MVVASGVDQIFERAVTAQDVPGVVALAADERGVIYEGALGKRGVGGEAKMTLDTLVWIASMTKAVTSAAAMQLVERGLLTLDEPVINLVPELGRVQVLEGFNAKGIPRMRPPRRPITLVEWQQRLHPRQSLA